VVVQKIVNVLYLKQFSYRVAAVAEYKRIYENVRFSLLQVFLQTNRTIDGRNQAIDSGYFRQFFKMTKH